MLKFPAFFVRGNFSMLGRFPVRRMRRRRREDFTRRLVRESRLAPEDLILPVFVLDGSGAIEPVASMPNVSRHSIDKLMPVVEQALTLGIPAVVLFPVIEARLKTAAAEEAFNADGLVPRCVREIKKRFPEMGVITDIALPGMDGIAVAKELRRTERPGLRIIGLSAHAGPLDGTRARAAGMDEFFTKPVSLARLADSLEQGPRSAALSIEARRSILDERLRARLAADFASETPRLLEEMHAALAARDWERLRGRAHYLKNSADVLGVAPLQDACRRLASFDDGLSPAMVAELLTAVTTAIPEKAFASADTIQADLK